MAGKDTRTLETERKYDVPAGYALPGLADLATAADPVTHTLHAEYHDTGDLRLARRSATLRRRAGGPDEGWHLKLPAGRDTRVELHAPLGASAEPPSGVRDLVLAYTRGLPLRPVAALRTARVVRALHDADGRVLAEIADDTVHATRPGGEPLRWREIEVELVHGDRALLDAVGRRLVDGGAAPARSPSKLARVLGDDVPPHVRPAGHPGTVGAAVTAYLARQADALCAHDPLARRAEFDAVHRMRVAVRRTRSTLRAYRRVIDPAATAELRDELAWLAGELGAVRDLEVLRMHCTARLDTLDRHLARPAAWLDGLARRERDAYDALNANLVSPRYLAVLDGLDALVTAPPFTHRARRDAEGDLPGHTRRAWRRLARAYEAATTPEERHAARRLAKQARYAAEAARPVLGEPAARMAEHAEAMQEVLGGFQDGQLVMARLREAAGESADPAEAFTLGVLYGTERRDAYAALDAVAATWARAKAAVG